MKSSRLFFLVLTLFPALAHAHSGHVSEINGLSWGFLHPLTGFDHLLAMLAVGLWAVQLGRRALWLLPLSFLTSMIVGASLGMNGIQLPFVEPILLASVVGLGALLAIAKPIPLELSALMVAIVALFHGQAHGMELPIGTIGVHATLGFLLSSAMLQIAGLSLGLTLQLLARNKGLRLAGATILSLAGLLSLI
jgi:urease accessory protein